jgi:hypothetical protein
MYNNNLHTYTELDLSYHSFHAVLLLGHWQSKIYYTKIVFQETVTVLSLPN